jgi:decaprenyl-phosphate phosphoribosyltransferase
MNSLQIYLRVFRVRHWIKNLFIFIPSFFAGTLFNLDVFQDIFSGFLSLCLIASGIYILNDIRDIEMDRLHPTKKNRPFAANQISKHIGLILMTLLIVVGGSLAYYLNVNFFILILIYLIVNIGYSLGLKSIPIVDLLIVSSGFIIRIYCGGILAGVPVTHWLSIMIFLLSLFIVLAKRKDDISLFEKDGTVVRKTSLSYNTDFINSCITMIGGVIIVAYVMYSISPEITSRWHSDYIFVTTIFVIAGIMRYLQLIFVEEKSGSPLDILYKDKFTIITLLSWIAAFFVIIYL